MGGGSGEAEESDVCRRRRETWRRGAAAGTWRSRREAGISFWSSSSTSRSFGGGIHRGAHAWLRAEWVREMNAVCKKARELRWRGVELFIHSNEAVGDRLVGNWTWSISPLRWRCVWARTLLRVFFCIFDGSVPLPGFILTQISQCPPFPPWNWTNLQDRRTSSAVVEGVYRLVHAVLSWGDFSCVTFVVYQGRSQSFPKLTPSIKSWNKKVNTRQQLVLLLCQSEPTLSKNENVVQKTEITL